MKNNLKELRIKAGLTQERLAKMLHITVQYVNSLETDLKLLASLDSKTMDMLCLSLRRHKGEETLFVNKYDLFIDNTILEFDKNGYLKIDSLYYDCANNLRIIEIQGDRFIVSRYYDYAEGWCNTTEHLIPYFDTLSKGAYQIDRKIHYLLLKCVPRNPQTIQIGRIITLDEFGALCSEHKLILNSAADDIGSFSVQAECRLIPQYEIYGEYQFIPIRVGVNSKKLEEELLNKGIEACAISDEWICFMIWW